MTAPSQTSPTSKMRQPLTKSDLLDHIIRMQSVGKSPLDNKLIAPKRPNHHRWSDYLRSPSISAQVISFEDTQHSSNFTLNSTYNELSLVSYLNQCFEILSQIGEGSFGNVYKVKDKATNKLFAIKVSKIKFRSKIDRDAKLKEVKWHIVLPTHPNCVRLYNAWEQDANLYIQIELCIASLDMLVQYSINNEMRLDEDSLWEILFDILQGLQNLHTLNFVHMDLKSANIFISADGVCKLGDFGLVHNLENVSTSPEEGDSKYLAAEVLDGVYTKSADIFSLGIVILELASLIELPSCGPFWQELRHGHLPIESMDHLSVDMKDVITRMINPKHLLRPSTHDLLKHPRFKYLKWKRFAQQTAQNVKMVILPMIARISEVVHVLFHPLVKVSNILTTRYLLRPSTEPASSYEFQSDDEDSYVVFASHFAKQNGVKRLNTPQRNTLISTPIFNTSSLSCGSTMLTPASTRPSMGNNIVRNAPTSGVRSFEGVRQLPKGKNLFNDFDC